MEVRNTLTMGTYNDDDTRKFRNERINNTMDTARVHELKTDPQAYNDIEANHKTHTVRVDDRAYAEGDYVILRKTKYTGEQMKSDNTPLVYMGLSIMCKILHIHSGPGLAEGFVVLSLKIIDRFPGRVV